MFERSLEQLPVEIKATSAANEFDDSDETTDAANQKDGQDETSEAVN